MNKEQVIKELSYRADRSSGNGGQHANKVSTRVTVLFSPAESLGLSDIEKQRVNQKLSGKISAEGFLYLSIQSHRSQHMNKKEATIKMLELLEKATQPPPPPRKKFKTRKNKNEIRQEKSRQSDKKESRKKIQVHLYR